MAINNARSSGKNTKWRTKVFRRDNYTCQICKIRGGQLEAHHLEGYAFNKKLRYHVVNGITLCQKCHHDFHKWNGGIFVRATRKQFTIWRKQL